jgi:glucans biosynthesis protein
MNRRDLLSHSLALFVVGLLSPRAAFAQAPPTPSGQGHAFTIEWLREQARQLAAAPYRPSGRITLPALIKLGPDEYHDIQFRPSQALWRDQGLAFQIRFFHLGHFFLHPITIHEVVGGQALPIAFSPEMFDYGRLRFEAPLPADLGFAGLRVHYHTNFERDMAAFLGASYFRAVDWQMQYGISARGLAIDTALPGGEEFPIFKTFWIERPAVGQTALTVYALLDSPSVTGAYTFVIHPGRTTLMDIEAVLYPRKGIKRLGLAPLTSMYLHGENDRRMADDFRPEAHDSDGLAILRGNGERLWRPLTNPAQLRVNAYTDENPRGFGLLQRDRDFLHYQEHGIYYNRRPNLWVEPRDDWGRGVIYLIEIPADEEIVDNIVVFWTPEQPAETGREIRLAYRLHWSSEVPDVLLPVGRVVATRLGRGGVPSPQKRPPRSRKFVIDFANGPLDLLAKGSAIEPVITVSRGTIVKPVIRRVDEINVWRIEFDLHWEGRDPIDLRCYLRLHSSALTETWIYQWTPPT